MSLFYRPNRRHFEAAALGLKVRYRNSKYFHGQADIEYARAILNQPKVAYDTVYVFEDDPQAELIADAYEGISRVVLVKPGDVAKAVEKAQEEPPEESGEAPEWPLNMSPEKYLKRFPEGPKAALARKVLGL